MSGGNARDFNNMEKRAVIKSFFPARQGAEKEIHATLTETLTCFVPGRAKDLSAPRNSFHLNRNVSYALMNERTDSLYHLFVTIYGRLTH